MQEYFRGDPDFYRSIKSLEKKRGLSLLSKLDKDSNEINFYSWMSEVRFGLFFDKVCENMKYDLPIDGKKPDWTIWMNGQKILAEVLRINTSEDELLEKIQRDKEISKTRRENPGVTFIERSKVKIMSSEFLYGHQSKLLKKGNKYSDIISKYKLPLLICMQTTLDTFLGDLDVFDFLVGNGKNGFFYQNKEFGINVTGVLLRTYFGTLVYFPNELAENKLNDANCEFLKAMHYKET